MVHKQSFQRRRGRNWKLIALVDNLTSSLRGSQSDGHFRTQDLATFLSTSHSFLFSIGTLRIFPLIKYHICAIYHPNPSGWTLSNICVLEFSSLFL